MISTAQVGRRFIAIAFCTCCFNPAFGQTARQAAVGAPEVKVGDSWTYDTIDGWRRSKQYTSVWVVTQVDDKGIHTEAKRTDNGQVSKSIHDRNWNRLEREQSQGRDIAEPYFPAFSFPLEVGKTWEQEVTFKRSYQ